MRRIQGQKNLIRRYQPVMFSETFTPILTLWILKAELFFLYDCFGAYEIIEMNGFLERNILDNPPIFSNCSVSQITPSQLYPLNWIRTDTTEEKRCNNDETNV